MIILVLYSINICGLPRFLWLLFCTEDDDAINNRLFLDVDGILYIPILLKFLFELDCVVNSLSKSICYYSRNFAKMLAQSK